MEKIHRLNLTLAVCMLLAAACGTKNHIDPLSAAPQEAGADPEFTGAVEHAQGSVNEFFAAFFSPSPTQSWAGLRMRFQEPDSSLFEYHWTEFVDYYDGTFTVSLLDGLTLDLGQHPGRYVQAPAEDLIDWMIIEDDGTFTGGYTVRLAYKRMTPAERRQFIEVTGYVMQ
ncbi:MAG TPA: DUF2314 domain-containing protein [Anaerolineales bacterium]|jgi:uncharacterized protein YegJ (DUF2314 family)